MSLNKNFLIFSFVLILLFVAVKSVKDFSELKGAAGTASKKGGLWLLDYRGKIGDPGILWAMEEMNQAYCHNDEISTKVKKSFSDSNFSSAEQAYKRLIDPKETKLIDYEQLSGRERQYDDLLIPALYCDINPLPLQNREKIFNFANSSGYELTHKYLAMLFLKNSKCLKSEVSNALPKAANKIAQEQQNSQPFSDLFAERAALLGFGGYSNLVKPEWIKKIIDHQTEKGGWPYNQASSLENEHTTALSTWALSQYSRTCPF